MPLLSEFNAKSPLGHCAKNTKYRLLAIEMPQSCRRRSESMHMAYDLDQISNKHIRIDRIDTSIDYISQLPDPIIQHILSFLPIQHAITTSVLSKRWVSVWAGVPVLNFSCLRYTSIYEFYRFVNEALRNYRGDKVKKLVIPFGYERWSRSQVDNWVRFALERNVEELHLVVRSGINYELSQSIYSNSSLKLLKTERCVLEPSGYVSWTSLQVLSIDSACFRNDAIAKILLGCPKLEYLELRHFSCDDNVAISSLNLKELAVHFSGLCTSTIEIVCPNIRWLSLFGMLASLRGQIRFINGSYPLEAEIGINSIGYSRLIGLLDQLRHVHKLTIANAFLEDLSRPEMQPLPSTLKCRSLTVATKIGRWHFHGIVKLLQILPDLEKLTINMFDFSFNKIDSNTKCWESIKTKVECDHLKSVEITGFEGRCVGFHYKFFASVLEFLLKNAAVLERIVIYAQSKKGSDKRLPDIVDLVAVNKLISSCPKASANVVVIFRHSFNQFQFSEL